jgi:hypothetical protein
VSAFTNSSTYTYEVAPVYSLMEIEVINHLLKFVGYDVRTSLSLSFCVCVCVSCAELLTTNGSLHRVVTVSWPLAERPATSWACSVPVTSSSLTPRPYVLLKSYAYSLAVD